MCSVPPGRAQREPQGYAGLTNRLQAYNLRSVLTLFARMVERCHLTGDVRPGHDSLLEARSRCGARKAMRCCLTLRPIFTLPPCGAAALRQRARQRLANAMTVKVVTTCLKTRAAYKRVIFTDLQGTPTPSYTQNVIICTVLKDFYSTRK